MSNEKFPLINSLGLYFQHGQLSSHGGMGNNHAYVRASDLEAVLAKASVVYGWGPTDGAPWVNIHSDSPNAPNTALLIAITPLRHERRAELSESQVREALRLCEGISQLDVHKSIIERLFGQGSDKGQSEGEA